MIEKKSFAEMKEMNIEAGLREFLVRLSGK
jgi:hypothetical protein